MAELEVDCSGKSEEEIMNELINRVLSGELKHINSIREISSNPWNDPNSFYTSQKFTDMIVMVDVDEFLSLHDYIGHPTDCAYSGTVDNVIKSVKNDNQDEIPTPPLSLEPDSFSENPMRYSVIHEGRSRAVGAKEAGLDEIPVLLAVRRPRK